MPSIASKQFTLNTGAKIPAVGFGTWKAAPGEAGQAVETALECGYRHLDCAPLYGNEAEIGRVLSKTDVPRSSLFVTTKLWSSDHQRVDEALERSLKDLQLEYVDLYLMHWPVTLPPSEFSSAKYGKEDRTKHVPDSEWNFCNTWTEMEKLLATGKVKAIGVANFSTVNLEKLLLTARVIPAVNQVESQPLLPQTKLQGFCIANGIHTTAFGPLGGSGSTLHTHPRIVEIAKKHDNNGDVRTSTGNVLLSWGVQRGWSVVPKSTSQSRIKGNLHGNFVLNEHEQTVIDVLIAENGGRAKRFNRPDWGITVFHDDEGLLFD